MASTSKSHSAQGYFSAQLCTQVRGMGLRHTQKYFSLIPIHILLGSISPNMSDSAPPSADQIIRDWQPLLDSYNTFINEDLASDTLVDLYTSVARQWGPVSREFRDAEARLQQAQTQDGGKQQRSRETAPTTTTAEVESLQKEVEKQGKTVRELYEKYKESLAAEYRISITTNDMIVTGRAGSANHRRSGFKIVIPSSNSNQSSQP